MDIRSELKREHSKEVSSKIVAYIGDDPLRFQELMKILVAGPYRITQRASWPMALAVEKYPALLLPYYKTVISLLGKPEILPGIKRNILRVLQYQEIPEEFEGGVLDRTFQLLEDTREPIAIRVFSMQVVYNLSERYPAIKPELKGIIEASLPYASAGFKSRAHKILPKL
ncbi:hypothetical protein DN752_09560 [Echinicola strongylocentroti]|uniref:Adenylosuccinate lyase n=1 Tax=Echinicola strongylocentroti TaxID=1795355 RepID=A0A2Z4II13_9BACT|nr:hypothetical protein [Echinicola strongylocentroti]AWW30347.1 hypothetical protein DN752_09560 [Echinicola strongylocentroti]